MNRCHIVAPVIGWLIAISLVWTEGVYAQGRGIRAPIAPAGDLINDTDQEKKEDNPTGSATLKTDPDLESILKKAERYQQDGNFSVACQLWQAVRTA
jgi:hypothetical protein